MSGLQPSPRHCSRAMPFREVREPSNGGGTMSGGVSATARRGSKRMKGRLDLVNPYVAASLAMCLVVLIALAGTAYLAVYFNRRGKADLLAALEPLAETIDGTVNLDEAEVSGKRGRWLVFGRMANASEGPGRVFQVDVVDAVGGGDWQYTSNPPRKEQSRAVTFEGPDAVRAVVEPIIDGGIDGIIDPGYERFRVGYSAEKGTVELTRAMRTRRDIPPAETFSREVDMLIEIAEANRAFVEAGEGEVAR